MTIRIPRIGQVVNPAGDILAKSPAGPVIVKTGNILLNYEDALMAIKYGWRVAQASGTDALVVYR